MLELNLGRKIVIIYLFIHEKNTVRAFTTDLLQRKVKGLEDDNRKLRAEASQLASESSETELREEQLLHQVVAQLGIIQLNVSRISVVSQSRPIFKISLLAPFPVANLSFGQNCGQIIKKIGSSATGFGCLS